MDAVYELRVKFGEDAQDIVASEYDDDCLQLAQNDDIIIVPRDAAKGFVEKLTAWVNHGMEMA